MHLSQEVHTTTKKCFSKIGITYFIMQQFLFSSSLQSCSQRYCFAVLVFLCISILIFSLEILQAWHEIRSSQDGAASSSRQSVDKAVSFHFYFLYSKASNLPKSVSLEGSAVAIILKAAANVRNVWITSPSSFLPDPSTVAPSNLSRATSNFDTSALHLPSNSSLSHPSSNASFAHLSLPSSTSKADDAQAAATRKFVILDSGVVKTTLANPYRRDVQKLPSFLTATASTFPPLPSSSFYRSDNSLFEDPIFAELAKNSTLVRNCTRVTKIGFMKTHKTASRQDSNA